MPPVAHAPRDQLTPATLSACIIACDEAESLPDCLASVAFCDEIVVVDSGSTDATVEIARGAGVLVVAQPWLGFAAQRNVALDHASCDWVLEIDADERVSDALRAEIQRFLATTPGDVDVAGIPRREVFLGRALGRAAKYPKYGHRLLRRGAYRHDEERTVHEGLVPVGVVHPFTGDLVHMVALTWREAVADSWRYARLEAGQLQTPRSPRALVNGALVRPTVKFVYRLTVNGGWRDGWRGMLYIALDCATDTVVWIRHFLDRRGGERGRSGIAANLHYGSRRFHRGCLRVLAVADRSEVPVAEEWLATARVAGADVALIGEHPAPGQSGVRNRGVARLGLLALIQALDAEEQLRSIDVVVAFGWRARLLLRGVPRGLRGEMPEITQETDPRTVNWRVRERPGAEIE
jgi:glycosyltransferase involved in cell wall biosynthesis